MQTYYQRLEHMAEQGLLDQQLPAHMASKSMAVPAAAAQQSRQPPAVPCMLSAAQASLNLADQQGRGAAATVPARTMAEQPFVPEVSAAGENAARATATTTSVKKRPRDGGNTAAASTADKGAEVLRDAAINHMMDHTVCDPCWLALVAGSAPVATSDNPPLSKVDWSAGQHLKSQPVAGENRMQKRSRPGDGWDDRLALAADEGLDSFERMNL